MATNFSDKNISSIKLNAEKYNLKSIPFHATEIEWSTEHLDYIPKQGEIVVYDKDDIYNYERIKIGDGLTSVINLPFYSASEQMDWNAAEGEPGHVLNRTHYEETTTVMGDTLTWDGNTEGRYHAEVNGILYYHVSDVAPTLGDLSNGGAVTAELNGSLVDDPLEFTAESIVELGDVYMESDSGMFLVAPTDGCTFTDGETSVAFEKKGLYFNYIPDYMRTVSLTIPGYNGFISEQTIIHKLPGKFLPDGVPYVERGWLLEETDAVESTDPNFGKCWIIQKAPILTIGETYTVIYNGVSYDCVCHSGADTGLGYNDETFAIGNFSVVGGVNTGEPFAMMIFPTVPQIVALDLAGAASVKIGIMGGEVVHKLEGKFLPDGVPYIEGDNVVEILPECQPIFNADEGTFVVSEGISIVPNVGDECIVNWNGTEYPCAVQDVSFMQPGAVGMGNGAGFGLPETSDPFAIMLTEEDGQTICVILPLDGTTELTISIKGMGEIVHKLDPRCLPDGLPYIEGEGTRKEVLPETTYTGLSSDGIEISFIPLTAGATYFVNWNGTEYECVAVYGYNSSIVIIGNAKTLGGNDTGEPFCIATVYNNIQTVLFRIGSVTEATLSIYMDGTVIHKIDERLLPDDIRVTYTLTKSGSDIKLIGSDGSETSVSDSDTIKTYTLDSFGVRASATELNYVDGVTSPIQTQLNKKPGMVVTGKIFEIDGVSVLAGDYAEVFNNSSNKATGDYSHAEGNNTTARSYYSHAEGSGTIANGRSSHAEGEGTTASGSYSHSEGSSTIASGSGSHAEGDGTIASNYGSHAEGFNSIASANYSHAEGYKTTAIGNISHVEGRSDNNTPDTITSASTNDEIITTWNATRFSLAKGEASHSEGYNTLSLGNYSHAEGESTKAIGNGSHAEGMGTIASGQNSHAQGTYNIEDDNCIHIVGNGTSDTDRKNIHTVGFDGSGWFQGDVYVGSTSGVNKDSGSRKLIPSPSDAVAGDLLTFDGTNWVCISKADLIAEIIAALPRAEEVSF